MLILTNALAKLKRFLHFHAFYGILSFIFYLLVCFQFYVIIIFTPKRNNTGCVNVKEKKIAKKKHSQYVEKKTYKINCKKYVVICFHYV